jgi:hypothetical protein
MLHVTEPVSIRALIAKGSAVAGLLLSTAACSSSSGQVESDIPDSEKSELINYIRACWYSPSPSQSRDFIVTIVMHMNRDATLQSAEIAESDRDRLSDPEYQTFAMAALRAVEKCAEGGKAFPINLERDYEIWSEVRARFRESDL